MLHVLYVDDEPDIREIVLIALSLDPELNVEIASSGHEAIERLRLGGIDLVLLDVMMPVMDGPATLANLRSDPAISHIPVVFVTARTQHHEVDKYISAGACGVIRKPFDPMSLAQEVKAFAPRVPA
jgi:CheY-like chemotaxis protein